MANKKSGLGGILKSVNDISRTANSVTRAKNSVSRTLGANKTKKEKADKKTAKNLVPTVDSNAWACACGTANTTKFCGGCGKLSPLEGACSNCGWKRTTETAAMKFCGECGTAFAVEGVSEEA